VGKLTGTNPTGGFTPGSTGELSWNTTVDVGEKPILVYFYDGHTFKGGDFDFSKGVEPKVLADKKVVVATRDFICEKICIKADELFREVPGREVLKKYLGTLTEPKTRKAHLALLTSKGELVKLLDRNVTPDALMAAIKEAKARNAANLQKS
jgi:hypothetical protein